MNVKTSFLFASVLCLITGCGTSNERAGGAKALYGTWACVSAVVDGKVLPDKTTSLLRLTITPERYKTEKGSEILFDSTYTINTSRTPREINMVGTEGDLTGKEAQGIFVIEGDRLQICYTMPGSVRPAKFESLPGSKAYWISWKRLP